MSNNKEIRLILLLIVVFYAFCLYLFYMKYVPLVKPFQIALSTVLTTAFVLTTINIKLGTLFFVFSFPLINNLPYFFGILEHIPHAPTALVLCLFYFFGWLLHNSFFKQNFPSECTIFKPIFLFIIIVSLSGVITFFRYTNFYPFLSNYIYELSTNAYGVSSGGAIMSIVFNSLNYLTGIAFFFIFLNTAKSNEFLRRSVVFLSSSTLLSLIFGLFQHFKNIKFGNNLTSIYGGLINATFKDALSFGAYIAITFPLILGGLFAFKGIMRTFFFLVIILSGYLLFFTGSKSGLLCLLISLFVFFLLSLSVIFNNIKLKMFTPIKISLPSIIIIFLIIALIFSFITFREFMTSEIIESKTLERLNNISNIAGLNQIFAGRAETLWKMALLIMRDYPLTGVGIGGFIIESSNYSEVYKTPIGIPQSAENYLLQVGSELGLVGIILVLWILWEIAKQMRRSYRQIPSNDPNKFILIGAIAGVVSFLVNIQAHTYIGSYEIKYTFWLLVALIFCTGRIAETEDKRELEKEPGQKLRWSKGLKISSVALIVLFSGVHLWNSTHSLSLKSTTERLGIKQEFGLDKLEKTNDGREFRWTRGYGGLTIKIEKPVIEIPLLASHPDIRRKPVKVKIYLIKDFFKRKRLLGEIILTQSIWKTYEYHIPEEVNQEVILLVKVSRTWNPLKTLGTPDPRNLGVAIGKIEFKDYE